MISISFDLIFLCLKLGGSFLFLALNCEIIDFVCRPLTTKFSTISYLLDIQTKKAILLLLIHVISAPYLHISSQRCCQFWTKESGKVVLSKIFCI